MSNRSIGIDDKLYRYLLDVSLREAPLLKKLREETARDPMAMMQIAPEQGQFMSLLVRMLAATRILEIGVFTGYSSLAMALAMPSDGYLLACDVSEDWTRVARRYWREAGVEQNIELRVAPAIETLDGLLADEHTAPFDFAFIDADKENYAGYYDRVLRLTRPGGVIAIDNVLWSGSVIDERDHDPDTVAIRAFNAQLRDDPRVDISLVPIADGLTLARKIG